MALTQSWHGPSQPTAGAADRTARRRVFQAAQRHSRRVHRLRLLLPAASAFALLAFLVITHMRLPGDLDLTVARTSVTRNSIIMDRPKITGFDSRDRGYSLAADRAIQALARPDQVRLENIQAKLSVAGGGSATVTAEVGDYDSSGGTLKLHGGIAVDSSEGYSLRMTGADVDMEAGTMGSANPVSVQYEDSQTTGASLSVTGGGQVIVLEGSVRTTLMPPKRRPAPDAPGTAGQEERQ